MGPDLTDSLCIPASINLSVIQSLELFSRSNFNFWKEEWKKWASSV